LPSFASRPFASRPVPFIDAAKAIWRWWRGTRLTLRELQLEAVAVERLVAELEEGETKSGETKPGLRQK
jgi:hypothetical protein